MPHHQPNEQAIRDNSVEQLKTVNEFIEQAGLTLVSIAEKMRKQVLSLPKGETRDILDGLISDLFEACAFEDIASRHTTEIIALLTSDEHADECMARHKQTREGLLSQEEVDKMFN
jgi:hypothetical protein